MKTPAPACEPIGPAVRMAIPWRTPVCMVGEVLHCDTQQKVEFVNLTELVEAQVRESGMYEGIALVQSMHSTAAVFLNEWQDALLQDFRTLMEQSVRSDAPWRHNDPRYSDCDRGNAASHLRALLLGTSVVLSV